MTQTAQVPSVGLYDFQKECLSLITGVLDVPRAISYLMDEKGRPICYRVHNIKPAMHRQYVDTYQRYDPLHPALFTENDAEVVQMSDLVSCHERPEHPYFREFIDPWGVRDIIELFLRLDNRLMAGFALFNLSSQPAINSDDRRKVGKLYEFMQFSLEQSLSSPKNRDLDDFCANHHLTNKERMVVELVTQGLPNKTIANDLDCSLATVKTHLQHIFQKLSINSKNELIALLYQQH
jgi:DNA-binding CsgD family transcriptional regulator